MRDQASGGPRVVVIVQARMGSTRLPGKVLMDLCGQPMLARVMERAGRAKNVHHILVATTAAEKDDPLEAFCRVRAWKYFRGAEDDVLDRFYQAAQIGRADIVVRVTADCPLVDPAIVDEVVATLTRSSGEFDYVSNTLNPRTYPLGLDVEAMTWSALSRAWEEDKNLASREHVTPFIYRNPQIFRLKGLELPSDLSQIRWTVDYPEDLDVVSRIYASFGHDRFGWEEALSVYRQHPSWAKINQGLVQRRIQ